MAGRRWQVVWSRSGLWALHRIPWEDAGRVDAAVQLFAHSGDGALQRVKDDPVGAFLGVPPYRVRLTLDPVEQTCTVWWIVRR